MAKNWITKKHLSQLLEAYSFKKNEFILDEDQESGTYRYSGSQKDPGIHLTVSSWYNSIQDKTEGYKVSLSDENGIITCTDFYRPEGDSLIHVMRNVPKDPRSDERGSCCSVISRCRNNLRYLHSDHRKRFQCSSQNGPHKMYMGSSFPGLHGFHQHPSAGPT